MLRECILQKLSFFLFFVVSLFLFSHVVFVAAEEFKGIENPIASNTFIDVINGVVGFLTPFAAAVVVIMILVGAFQILFAEGDPKKITTGRSTLLWAAVGFAIIALATIIVDAIKEFTK